MFDNYGHSQAQTPTTPPEPQKVMRFDKGYVTTLPGMLKVAELICNLVGFICIKVAWGVWVSGIFYNLLYWIGNIVTGILLFSYTFHIVEKFDRWPWHKFELFFCAGMVLGYIIVSIFAMTLAENAGYAVGFFGFCAVLAYGLDAYLKYKGWKRGLPPQ